jgi:hypothetical protein
MSGTKVIGAGLATNSIQLDHADIIRVQSVISGGVDVTPNWALDNGQRDFYYQKGALNRKFGVLQDWIRRMQAADAKKKAD